MDKKTRLEVYQKYSGHCAYCGKEIAYKDMQVDHIVSKYHHEYFKMDLSQLDDMPNLNPACRSCNYYKSSNTIEHFREYIREIPQKLKKEFIYKVGLDYGIIQEPIKNVVFYFETANAKSQKHLTQSE